MPSDSARLEPHFEADLSELAAKFAASGGPALSPGLSADLALEVVLHEIVEQACLATGATGAAIVLERDGEMVCRASSGPTAPELGARLDVESGLSRECIRTWHLQRCDDARVDSRADVEASLRRGVRSVLLFPLVHEDKIVGIFEAFSSRPSAFGERDERTLEALAGRILKNLQRVAQPLALQAGEYALANSDSPPQSGEAAPAESSRRGLDIVTRALGVVVLACAVWLGVRVVQRFAPPRAYVQAPSVKTKPAGAVNESGQDTGPTSRSEPASIPAAVVGPTAANGPTGASGGVRTNRSSAPEGTLFVYEKGKEIFRMPPSPGQGEGSNPASESGMRRASSVQTEVVELTPAAAEDSLIHRVEPEYPEKARQEQMQGAVVLEVRIRPDGTVNDLKVASGQPLLADAAIAAVKQWRFKPQQVDGQPAAMQTTITLNFRLPH